MGTAGTEEAWSGLTGIKKLLAQGDGEFGGEEIAAGFAGNEHELSRRHALSERDRLDANREGVSGRDRRRFDGWPGRPQPARAVGELRRTDYHDIEDSAEGVDS